MEHEIRVEALMSRPVIVVRVTDSLAQAASKFEQFGVQHLPVVDDEGRLVGMVSDRDLIRKGVGALAGATAAARDRVLREIEVGAVTSANTHLVAPSDPAWWAARLLREHDVHALPVVEGGALVGIVSSGDFVRWFERVRPRGDTPWVGPDPFQD